MDIRYRKWQFVVLIITSLYSCGKNSCPFSSGGYVKETRTLSSFHKIILYDKINLVLTQDSAQQIIVEAGGNLLAGIQTIVENDILTIQDKNHCGLLRDPGDQTNVYISGNQLQKITYYGAGNIRSTNILQASEFTIDSWLGIGSVNISVKANQISAIIRHNNADITIAGEARSFYIYCAEVGSVNSLNLNASTVSLDSRSIKDISVSVSDSLEAHILYKGNVYYKGNPSKIHSIITNSGKLIHLP